MAKSKEKSAEAVDVLPLKSSIFIDLSDTSFDVNDVKLGKQTYLLLRGKVASITASDREGLGKRSSIELEEPDVKVAPRTYWSDLADEEEE